MERLLALLAVATVCLGCQSGQTFENPFTSRTTVPPPGTAAPGMLPGAYDGGGNIAPPFNPNTASPPVQPPATLLPSSPPPAASPPPGLPQYEPAGGFDFRQTQMVPTATPQWGSVPPPTPVVAPRVGPITSPSEARWGHGSTAVEPVGSPSLQHQPEGFSGPVVQASAAAPAGAIRVASPGGPTRSTEPQEPNRLPDNEDFIDIMDLPAARSTSGAGARPAAPARAAVRSASYQSENRSNASALRDASDAAAGHESAADGTANSTAGRSRGPVSIRRGSSAGRSYYGHGPDFAWLEGKLEYSQIDRRWKLRYIPVDGETDAHGGSVVLLESPLLDGFQPGDFVAVQGALAGRSTSGFAPDYELTGIKRLD